MIEVKDISETQLGTSAVLSQLSALGHEQVVFCNDAATGLKAIIAIHNTICGPSLGGTRMWPYTSEAEALTDVLRLSRGMTYKSAISGLNLGGGKAVIIGDSRTQKNEALFRRFGKFVNSLAGKYITAEDVGVTTKDIEYIAMETKHVAGKPEHMGGSGDPSPVTAYGVYMGMKASAKRAYGSDSLSGKMVVVQGAGNVGAHLVDYLVKEGAKVKLFDIHNDKVAAITGKHSSVQAISADEVYSTPMDIYAPCALGATINDDTLKLLSCQIIAGAANNQLKDEVKHGLDVLNRGLFYAPDFLINAGGVINCYTEVVGTDRKAALKHTENIYNTTLSIYEKSAAENIPTSIAANKLAEQRIESIGKLKQTF
ncbi:MAG TPA: Glu/Leu/Phe/Val dehydrogenase dimerization domain-containing protein [Luteibaculaceae bacterium]|nr:Glu/Leu/Phe/Val dehydrogenase dimerization domain-containing protein [Luteibaculaceae bacterium]